MRRRRVAPEAPPSQAATTSVWSREEVNLPGTASTIPASLLTLAADAARPMAVLSPTTELVAWSAAWGAAFGPEESGLLLGRGPALARSVSAALDGASVARSGVALPDGRRVRWSVAPWRGPDNAVRALVVFADLEAPGDDLVRRPAEREGLLPMLFEESPLGLILCTVDGTWIEANDAFLDIIGCSAEEAQGGLTWRALAPRERDAEEAERLASLSATGRYGPVETELIRRDGSRVPVRLRGVLVERDGQAFIWSFVEDITERDPLQAEREREARETTPAARLATLGEMAAGIAHEISSPLALVDASACLAEDALASGEAERVAASLAEIRRAVARAAHIVRGLRRFARARPPDPDAVTAVPGLLDDALAMVSARLRDHGVALVREEPEALVASGGALEIGQVLVNLLLNAIEAVQGREGATVWLRVTAGPGPEVHIAVEDNGPGVPPDQHDRLFEPSFTTKGEGAGLGLSISRGIVQAAGGRLVLDPDAGRTRFVVSLPAAPR